MFAENAEITVVSSSYLVSVCLQLMLLSAKHKTTPANRLLAEMIHDDTPCSTNLLHHLS